MRGILIIFTRRVQKSRVTASSNGEAVELSGDQPATSSSSRSPSEDFFGQHLWRRRVFPHLGIAKKYMKVINKLVTRVDIADRMCNSDVRQTEDCV